MFVCVFYFIFVYGLILHAGLFWCFHNPSNSDTDYRIFNIHVIFFACIYTQGGLCFIDSSKILVLWHSIEGTNFKTLFLMFVIVFYVCVAINLVDLITQPYPPPYIPSSPHPPPHACISTQPPPPPPHPLPPSKYTIRQVQKKCINTSKTF